VKKENYFAIALTYIGTIIGAGFASGQEIKNYFVNFGISGIITFTLASFLFFYLGKKIMIMGYESNAESYDRVLTYAFTCRAKKLFDYLIIFFLTCTVMTMFSGMGAILSQSFNVPFFIGSFIMLLIAVVITLGGINKIMKMSLLAIPILIISTFLIAVNSFQTSNFTEVYLENSWLKSIFSAIVYVSYNIVMAISILPVLGNSSKDKNSINKSSILSGIIIAFFGLIICFSLFINYSTIQFAEVPLAVLAKQSNHIYSSLYLISFIIAVATTAVSALYGIYTRINRKYSIFSVVVIISYLGSLFGFSVLVKYLYTFMGYIGFIIIYMLLRGFAKRKKDNI